MPGKSEEYDAEERRGIMDISGRVSDLLEEVKEMNRTIRGHNGYMGMVTQIALIDKAVQDLTGSVNTITTALKGFEKGLTDTNERLQAVQSSLDQLNETGCAFGREAHSPEKSQAAAEKTEARLLKQTITWEWAREKLLVPVLVAVILTIVYNLPKIAAILNSVR